MLIFLIKGKQFTALVADSSLNDGPHLGRASLFRAANRELQKLFDMTKMVENRERFFPWPQSPSRKGSTLTRRNSLLEKQTFSFKS